MEMNTGTNSATGGARRIHPVMAAAAVAVIVASITAVAAMSGLLPKSQGSASENLTAPSGASVQATEPAPAPRQPLVAQEPAKPAPAKRTAARSTPKEAKTAATETAAATPAPIPAPRNVGTVESVRTIAQQGEGTGLGAVAGGVLGAVIGHQVGNGTGQKVMTAAGAAGGAYAGHQIEKRTRGTKRWEIGVRMEDGTLRTISTDAEPTWRTGDRVRVVSGTLQAA